MEEPAEVHTGPAAVRSVIWRSATCAAASASPQKWLLSRWSLSGWLPEDRSRTGHSSAAETKQSDCSPRCSTQAEVPKTAVPWMATRGVKRESIPTKHKQSVSLYLCVFLCSQLKTTEEDRGQCFGLMSDSVSVSRKLLQSARSRGDSTELKTGYIFTFAWRNEPLRCKQSTVASCNSLIWLLNGGKCTEKRRGERKDPAGLQRNSIWSECFILTTN